MTAPTTSEGWILNLTRDGWDPLAKRWLTRRDAIAEAERRGWSACYVGELVRVDLGAVDLDGERSWSCVLRVTGIQRVLLCPDAEAASLN